MGALILDLMTSDSADGICRLATRAQLLASGMPLARQRALVRRGDLVAVSRGVYASPAEVRRIRSARSGGVLLASAAVLATIRPGAVTSHHSAAAIHLLDLLNSPPAAVAITRPAGTGSKSGKPGVQVHTAALPSGHVTRCKGVPVTTAARTVLDLARVSSFRAGLVTADSALRSGRATKAELAAVLADCARWPGAATAAAVVQFADRKSESALESIARALFQDLRFPPPELQAWLGSGDDFVRVDFLWRRFRTVVEVDGAVKYMELADDPGLRARQQLRRDAFLREHGYEVVHFTWDDITRDEPRVAAAVRMAFRRGAWTASRGGRCVTG